MRRDESSQMKHSEHDKLFALKWMPRLQQRDNQALVLHHLSFGQKLIGEVMGIMWMASGCAACHKISFSLTTARREAAVSHRRHVIGTAFSACLFGSVFCPQTRSAEVKLQPELLRERTRVRLQLGFIRRSHVMRSGNRFQAAICFKHISKRAAGVRDQSAH